MSSLKINFQQLSAIFRYVLLLAVIFVSDEAFLIAGMDIHWLDVLKDAFLLVLPFVLLAVSWKDISKAMFKPDIGLWVTVGVVVFSFVSHFSHGWAFAGGPFVLSCVVVSAYLLARKYPLDTLFVTMRNIMFVVIVYSFLIWLLTSIGWFHTTRVYTSTGNPTLFSWGIMIGGKDVGDVVTRCSSFFREPGVYVMYINFVYIFDIYCSKKPIPFYRHIIYLLGVFTTFSTAGIIVYVLLSLGYLLHMRADFKSVRPFSVLILAVVVFVVVEPHMLHKFFNKIFMGVESHSYLARLSSLVVPMVIAFRNPLFGCGICDFYDVYDEVGGQMYGQSLDAMQLATNTIGNLSAVYGMAMGLFVLVGFVMFAYRVGNRNALSTGVVLLSLLFLFSNESLMYSVITYLLVFYGLQYFSKPVSVTDGGPAHAAESNTAVLDVPSSRLVSFVIPCYNAEATIARTVSSVVNQQGLRSEIVLVNDGSTDNTLAVLHSIASQYGNVRVVDKPNGGVSSARNVGIEKAQGDYIVFLDADDEFDKSFADKLIPRLEAFPDMVLFAFDKEEGNGRVRLYRSRKTDDPVRDYLLGSVRICMCSMAVRRSLIDTHHIRFDEGTYYSEDREFIVKCLLYQSSVVFLDDVLFHYRCCPTSAMHETRYTAKYITSMEAMDRVCELLKDNPSRHNAARVQLNLTIILHFRQYLKSTKREASVWDLLLPYGERLRKPVRPAMNVYTLYVRMWSRVYKLNRQLFYKILRRI